MTSHSRDGENMKKQRPSRPGPDDFTDMRVGLYCRVSKPDPHNPDERERSTTNQDRIGRDWVDEHGARLVEVYSDEGIGASRFGKKARAEFNRLVADVADGKLDVLWCWELSRLSRRPAEFHQLLDLCRDMGVWWVEKDQPIDLQRGDQVLLPSIKATLNADEIEKLRSRVLDGVESNALAGRPHGQNAYGHKRVYDPETRKLVAVVPDEFDGDERPIEDSPAGIVREIFERIASGDSLNAIRRDLDDRGIPTPHSARRWSGRTIRVLAMHPRYIGQRVHQGKVLEDVTTKWPPLVAEETFWAVQRILTDPSRATMRPARARYLLSSLIRCAACGDKLRGVTDGRCDYATYLCRNRSCVGIGMADMDAFVEELVVRWLESPTTIAALNAVDDSAAAAQARTDADRARVELEDWRQYVDRGDVTLVSFARAEKRLLAQIADADKRAHEAAGTTILTGRVGEDARVRWYGGVDEHGREREPTPLEVKRQVIRKLLDIRVRPGGRGFKMRPGDRTEWRWLLGIESGVAHVPPDWEPVSENLAMALVELSRCDGSMLQRDLSSRSGIGTAAAQRAVSQLRERGWIDRVRTPNPTGRGGRPTFTLTLTDAGREVAAAYDGESG